MRLSVISFLLFFTISLQAQSIQEIQYLLLSEQLEKAKAMIDGMSEKNPSNAELDFYSGEYYLQTEDSEAALLAFENGISKNGKVALNYVGKGKVIFDKDAEEAKGLFDKAITLSKSKNANVLNAIAEFYVYSEHKNTKLAMEYLEKSIKIDPNNVHAFLIYGDAYLEENNGTAAIEKYNKVIFLNESDPRAYCKIGKLYGLARNYDLAIDYFEKALLTDPNYLPAYKEMGEAYYKDKQIAKALEAYKTYVDKTNNNQYAVFRYSSFLYLNKDYKSAIENLKPLAEEENVNPYALRILGYASYELGDFTASQKYLETFFNKSEKLKLIVSDHEYYAKSLIKLGNEEQALVQIKKAVALDQNKAGLFNELAESLTKKGNHEFAANVYKTKINSSSKVTAQDYFDLGKAYYSSKNYTAADSSFSKLTETRPDFLYGHLFRARSNSHLDPESEEGLAKPYYEKVIETVVDTEKNKRELIEAHSYMGYFYLINKENKLASEHWKKVNEYDPTNKEAEQIVKGLQ